MLVAMDELPLAEIARIARKHGATSVKIFGSRARGTARPDSDLDLLVNVVPGTSLFDLARMALELEALLGIQVEVVTEPGLRPELRDEVPREAKSIAA
jgi:predicted nucleotidyltransferase